MVAVRFALLFVVLCGCDDDAQPYIVDLEGPHGRAVAPGPWPVEVLASDGRPQILWAIDDGDFAPLELQLDTDRYRGELPDQPLGTTLRYFARVADDVEPANPRTAEVVEPRAEPDSAAPPGPCALAFRRPRDGDALTLSDDAAPQAGLQLTVVLETNLADGVAARLRLDGVGYSGATGAGVLAFEDVNFRDGEQTLTVTAVAAGGAPCERSIMVRASVPAQP
jgi:hypothetical protein